MKIFEEMKTSDWILTFALLASLMFISLGSVMLISKVSEDIHKSIDWSDNITSNSGRVIGTGQSISIWQDGSGKMHAGFMLGDKQYELQVIE